MLKGRKSTWENQEGSSLSSARGSLGERGGVKCAPCTDLLAFTLCFSCPRHSPVPTMKLKAESLNGCRADSQRSSTDSELQGAPCRQTAALDQIYSTDGRAACPTWAHSLLSSVSCLFVEWRHSRPLWGGCCYGDNPPLLRRIGSSPFMNTG
ncbi:UNVERIFIED_CONTAM: hypothetical protein K2H54_061874 [Gekko kuhli]